ncbi:hypothetical protein [Fibrobacter sp. UBA2449]|uniref:hypothetical protein n=1 Tax=Fibrobacter sp. UBA2449 TaxID=1946529 RepID=UPI0025C09DAD|nr:hypothetical protein [Fibrobacter sp. UBA2449]
MNDKIRLRVEYADDQIFYIISSSNANEIDNWDQLIGEPYVIPNGLASILMRSDNARKIRLDKSFYFKPGGDASEAADELIERITKAVGSKPIFKQRY